MGFKVNLRSLILLFLQVLLECNNASLFPAQLYRPLQLSGQLTSWKGLLLCYLLSMPGTVLSPHSSFLPAFVPPGVVQMWLYGHLQSGTLKLV